MSEPTNGTVAGTTGTQFNGEDQRRPAMPTTDVSLWPRFQNVVSTFNMECRLDLQLIAQHARNVEYRPKKFAAAIVRIRNPKTTALVFNTGRCVVTGARSVAESSLAAKKFVKIMQKLGFGAQFKDFQVRNIVASAAALPQAPKTTYVRKADRHGSLGIRTRKEWIRMEGFASKHFRFAKYDPELFVACFYRFERPKLVSTSFCYQPSFQAILC